MRLSRGAVFLALTALGACSSDNRQVLIVYSPHGKELLEYFEKGFEKAHPDIDVQWVDMGSQEVLERVRAEKPNPQADVWFGAPADAPKDWDDLIDPKWKGKILIRDPIASGTMRAIFGAIMVRSIQQTGKPDAGYEWLRKLDANTREYVLNPMILYQKLGRQEGVVTMW